MNSTQWKNEIEKLERDMDITEVRAAEIMTDGSDCDAFLILQKWALKSMRGINVKADFELVRELRDCLEGVLTNVAEHKDEHEDLGVGA